MSGPGEGNNTCTVQYLFAANDRVFIPGEEKTWQMTTHQCKPSNEPGGRPNDELHEGTGMKLSSLPRFKQELLVNPVGPTGRWFSARSKISTRMREFQAGCRGWGYMSSSQRWIHPGKCNCWSKLFAGIERLHSGGLDGSAHLAPAGHQSPHSAATLLTTSQTYFQGLQHCFANMNLAIISGSFAHESLRRLGSLVSSLSSMLSTYSWRCPWN